MREVQVNAEQIRSSADSLEKLAKTPDAKWAAYDQQWNMIKPAQERIDLATQRLERVEASLSPAQRMAFDQAKREVGVITSETHDLWLKLGQPKVDLGTPALRADARGLDDAARELIKATAAKSKPMRVTSESMNPR